MLITVDWLAFAVREVPDKDIFSFLGIFKELDWHVGAGNFGAYPDTLRYGSIQIGINGVNGYEFYVQLSGQGCREFEDLMPAGWQWESFLKRLNSDEAVSIRRLDIAGDEREGYFNIERFDRAVSRGCYATRCKMPTVQKYGREVCYVGSSTSSVLMRFYNKKLERGFSPEDEDGKPWWRCELQLRDEYCSQMIDDIIEYGIGKAFSGHCLNHIRWLQKPNDNKNSQRIKTAKWYDDFLGDCEKLKFTSAPGSTYNFSKLQRYIVHQAGSSIVTMAKVMNWSPQQFYDFFMDNDNIKLRDDQIDMLVNFGVPI